MRADTQLAEAVEAFQTGDLDRARSLAEAQLAREPRSPQLMHLLGLIECRAGRLETGIDWLRRAVETGPDNLAFRVMLARALVDSGRAAEALEIAGPQAGASPAELAIWHVRAEAAQAATDHASAAQAWQVMTAARPDDWRAWANYGQALVGLERWPEAADALRRAAALNPKELSLQQNFASALAHAGRHGEAADQLQLMLDAGSDDAGIRLFLARLLADLGRHEESMAQLDRAAHLSVGEAASGGDDAGLIQIALGRQKAAGDEISAAELRSLRELAMLLERTNRMEALASLLDDAAKLGIGRDKLAYPAAAVALRNGDAPEAKRLLELQSPDDDRVRRYRLLAKIEDALGNAAAAFAAAQIMNRSVDDFDEWVRRGAEYRQRLHSLANAVTPEWASQLRPLEPGARRTPAFLVGFPRSGTTLLDTFLMGHPDIEVLEEFHMLGAAEKVLGHVADLPNRSRGQLEQARAAYFDELDRHVDPKFPGLVVDKLPLNMLGVSVIYCLFPDARIIFAQRHPCDAVLSGHMQSFTLNDAMACFLTIEHAADLYDAAIGVFTRSRDAVPVAVHDLIYEELIADPQATLAPLIDFLGLEWRRELLDHRSTAKARGAIITPSYDQVTQPLSKAPSGRWRRYEKQLKPVLPVLLPWAERLGYPE
jgi:Flp pilus assembly protein TadD